MSVTVEEFVAHLGWEVDGDELENFNDQVKDTAAFFAKAAAAIAGATIALTAFTVATNRQTSIQTQLAEAYDISAESAENWGFLLGAVGLEANNVIRAAKDLNIRLGQAFSGIGDANTIKDAVKSLGIEFESLRDQKPEQQFRTILQAAKDLDNGQIALAASQQLLGRQGAIVTGFLRDQKGTIEELLIEQAKFNFLTQENREQAMAFTALMDNVGAVTDSVKASFAAYLGEALTPLAEEFLEWVKLNRELIKIKIAEWAERIGRFMSTVFRVMRWGLLALDDLVDKFGGLENVLAILAGMLAGFALVKIINLFMRFGPVVLKAVAAVKKLTVASALLGAKWLLAAGAIALAGLAINSLVRFFQGKDSLVGEIGEAIANSMNDAQIAMLEFMGLTKEEALLVKEEMDLRMTQMGWSIEKAFKKGWKIVRGFSENLNSLTFKEFTDIWGSVWDTVIDGAKEKWFNLIRWINTTIRDLLRKIPVIGKFIRTAREVENQGVRGGLSPSLGGGVKNSLANVTAGIRSPALTQQLPSLGVLQTINQTRELLNTVNNTKTGGSPTLNATFNVTQQPGQSGEDLARQIQSGIKESWAGAIRDNDTGIER